MEHKSNRKNIIYTLVSQFLVLGLALVVPRFILVSYGSDTNGLIGTVSQVMAYLALLEAGIGRAARNELYKYLHGDIYDKENISVIMSLSRKTYRNITKIYALIILAFSFILPYIIKTDLDYWTVFAVVIIEGASGVVSFFFIQNWTDLLAVDGRNYVTSNIDLVYKVLIYLVKIVMAVLGVNIIFMELPKAEGLEGTVDTNTALENWAVFLKDADNPEKKDIIDKLTSIQEGLMQAQKSLSSISEDRSVWIAQYRQEMFERDRISGLYAARQEGLEEGLKSTARSMLADGVSAAQIAKWTGLSPENIASL